MPWTPASTYLYGPLLAIGGLAVLVLLLRWAFSRGVSVVERPARDGPVDDYGLLVAVAAPATFIEGEIQRRTLESAGVRAMLATTNDGPRLMVWPDDETTARRLLREAS